MFKSLLSTAKSSQLEKNRNSEMGTALERQTLLESHLTSGSSLYDAAWANHMQVLESARRNFLDHVEGSKVFYKKAIDEAQGFINTHAAHKPERQGFLNTHSTTLDPEAIVPAPVFKSAQFFHNPVYENLSPPSSPQPDTSEIFGCDIDLTDNDCCTVC